MKPLTEITDNLKGAIDRYDVLPLDDVRELAEVLKILGVNLSYLVHVRDEYYKSFQSHVFNSRASSAAAKKSEAEFKVPELDLCRKILKHYGETQTDIRSQISLRKTFD
jgi:hypothetical protein